VQPIRHTDQAPISKLTPEMLYRQVQFLVEENDWGQGHEVEAPREPEERGA
jgi:hypothetical protein